ncbi:hypothetical protein ABPG74_020194 [Tetrahymena malaccensis]
MGSNRRNKNSQFTVLYNQPAYSAIIQVIYQPGQSKTIFNMKYMQYKYFQEKAYFANQKQNLISTDANGFIGVNQSLESMYTIFYSISSSELQIENNIIIDVIQNQFFGIIIVIKKFNILVFNSYTNQLIDNLQFGDSNASIVQYQLKQGEQPFIIACKANSLLIKSLDSQSQNTISDQQLNGFLNFILDDLNTVLFIYGQFIEYYQYNGVLINIYIQSTQIYVYDIVQQTQITIIQSQSNYSQGNLYTGIVYDNEFYQLTTLSQSGNLYSISYQNFQSPQQLSKFIEFNPPQAPYAKGLNLDLTTNNCLLFSDQYVLQVDYSRLTNFFKQLQLNKNTLYSKVVLKEQNSLPYYVLAGQNNTLYTYNNFSVQYFGFVKNQNQIVDLQFIEQYQLLIIAFLQELRVYNITNVNVEMNYLIDDLPYSQELKFQINRFLTPSIFLTIDNQVVHYNFITMTVTQNIPLYSILSKFYINNSQTILILGLSNGDIIFYFLQNSNQLKFTLNLTKNKNSIKFIQETNSFIWIGSLNSYVIGFNKTNNQQQLNIYLNQYSNNNITTDLTVLEVDEENKRLFYNYLHQKVIYILDYTSPNSQIIKYMQFPGSHCEACQYGTYSLQKFDNFNYTDYTNQNQLQQICKKCPQQANFCQGKTIQLQEGYWRESILEDETNLIQYCTNSPQNCQEQYHNQIKGCIDGYIGPLCETCDSLGEVCSFQLSVSTSIDIFQSPQHQLLSSLDCLINSFVDNRIQRIQLNLILEKLNFFQISKYHFYTLANVMFIFFQPASLVYFIKSLSCRKIASKSYTQIDLTINCYDDQYKRFVYPFSSCIFFAYVLIPFFIFYQIKKSKQKLNFCQVRFKYGYYYTEYKPEYYYWDLKIKSSVTLFGKIFRCIYKYIQSEERFNSFIKKNQTSFEVYQRWKFLRNNRKSALFKKNITTILSVQHSNNNQKIHLKRRISQFINQNQILIQSNLSSFSNSLNKMNSSYLDTNGVQTPIKRLITKSNFGGEKKQLSLQTEFNENQNYRGQNTILSQLNQQILNKNKSIDNISNDTIQLQNQKNEQSDQYELSFCGQVKFVQAHIEK